MVRPSERGNMDDKLKKYIPKKVLPRLTDYYNDPDGYWAYCERGYHFAATDCHTEIRLPNSLVIYDLLFKWITIKIGIRKGEG